MNNSLRITGCLLFTLISCFAQPYGLSNRVANTTLQMPAALPTFGMAISNAFPGVSFSAPIAFASPPGETNRLFILERAGRVMVISNLVAPDSSVFLNLSSRVTTGGEEGLLGIAFHPNYAVNRYFYLFYSLSTNTAAGSGRHQRVSRFEASPDNPNFALPDSELPLITQFDDFSNHNGGDIHFSPNDGYLYISLGDEGAQDDAGNNSQRIDRDFFAGILRIDVDKRSGNLLPTPHPALMGVTNYYVPADNPFVGATQLNGVNINTNTLRAEFWAIGLRNPWRMSFDAVTGALYVGDVGGSQREEVNVITAGGNYGWVWREGFTNLTIKSSQAPPGFSPLPPILEYPRGEGNSITGGVLYRSNRVASLTGKYVFCDYGSGNIWSLTPNGTNPVSKQLLFTDGGIVAFGFDPRNGDILMADIVESQIKRIVPVQTGGAPPPPTLAQAGIFSDMENLVPHPGIVEYDVNVPQWADNAHMRRWFSIPALTARMAFRPTNNWQFSSGTVWIQHFELETTNGVPESRRRIETRILAGGGTYGVTYRWTSPTNATLVPAEGASETIVIDDGGVLRDQVWNYPSLGQCMSCHNTAGGRALGFNTPQLNRDFHYANGVVDNQIRAFNFVNYFTAPQPTNLHLLLALAHPTNEAYSLEYRSRSYLFANCASCHAPGVGPAPGFWDARIYRPFSVVNLANGSLNNSGGDTNNRVVVPGDTAHSMLLTRIATNGAGKMPPVGHTLVDTQAVALLSRWINEELPAYRTFAQWQMLHFNSTNSPQSAANADPDTDGARNMLEYLTGTNPNATGDAWGLTPRRGANGIDIDFQRIANRNFDIQWSTNAVTNATSWRGLNVPENRPFAAKTNSTWRVSDGNTNGPTRFYRARVYEP